jgi:hypothetical protein
MMRRVVVLTAVGALGLGVAGCAGFRVERNGKDVGQAICDMKTASNANQAQRAFDKYQRNANKAATITGRNVGEDVQDIDNNLNDLKQHVSQGNKTLAKQDVAVIQRNVEQVAKNAPGLTGRFYQGVLEGLGSCT